MKEKTKKQWSNETIKTVDKLCLFDDDLMSLAFDRNIEATEFLLNTILERDDLKVIEVVGQRSLGQTPDLVFAAQKIRPEINSGL